MNKRLTPEILKLVQELQTECEKNRASILSLVVVGHLLIEEILDEIIRKKFTDPKYYLKADLTFFQKANLAFALGSVPGKEVRSCILSFNELRNKFAHDRKYQLISEDIKKITIHNDENSSPLYTEAAEYSDKIIACVCSICGYLAASKSNIV